MNRLNIALRILILTVACSAATVHSEEMWQPAELSVKAETDMRAGESVEAELTRGILHRSLHPSLTFRSEQTEDGNAEEGDLIIYTAHQGWLSRIYVMDRGEQVLRYFQYDFYFWADLEVVDGEVYAAEAFAPRVYKFNPDTGDLDLLIDDWSLYYFYDVGFLDDHYYLTEWDLNRYNRNGSKTGTTSFNYDVNGSTARDGYLYTLNDDNIIRVWDVSQWPSVTQHPELQIAAPTEACRGLWYDGQYFWTAESIDGQLGWIYLFDENGEIMEQIREPAFRGWAACLLRAEITGDLDGDGDVDQADLGILLSSYGVNDAGDVDGDGDTDQADLGLLLAHWGEGTGK